LGVTLYAAMGTRAAGVALIPGLVLHDVLRYRKVTRLTVIAVTVCISLVLLQNYWIGSAPGGYIEQIHAITAQTILFNAVEYARVLAGFWVASVRNAFSFAVLAVVALLILTGIFSRSRQSVTVVECLLVPYLGILLLWPYAAGVRAVFPVIPWIVFLAITGLREVSAEFIPHYSRAAAWGFLMLLAIPFAQGYRGMNFGPIREDQGLTEFNQLCDAVREQSEPRDIFVYYRARALSLYTGRAASTYNYRGTEAELGQHLEKIHAAYLITTSAFDDDHGFIGRYVQRHPEQLDLTYQNAKFSLYRVRSTRDAASASAPRSETQSN
jgi:hypothetical protein